MRAPHGSRAVVAMASRWWQRRAPVVGFGIFYGRARNLETLLLALAAQLEVYGGPVRKAAFHPHFPLLASASDDGTVHIFHARVFSDLMKNPLIVPLKILRGHEVSGGMGVMSIVFHPTQPWIFSGGADGTIRLFSNIP